MPRKRRADKRRPAPAGLPVAMLHRLVTGDLLDQDEGEARYGKSFEWPDACHPVAHPLNLAATWAAHRAEIEAHAASIGCARPWIAEIVETLAARARSSHG